MAKGKDRPRGKKAQGPATCINQKGFGYVFVPHEISCSNLTNVKYFKSWTIRGFAAGSIVNFKVSELVEMHTI